MEVEEPTTELITNPVIADCEIQVKDLNEDDHISLDKTIEVENSSLKSKDINSEVTEVNSSQDISSENGKKKVKEEKPPSKIVVRRLPPTMTKDHFLEQVSPLPEVDYMYYVQGDVNNNINPFSRAYLNFVSQEDLFSFSRTFDNYVFLDAKGQEYPAIVEFAMFQRVPKQRTKKKDPLVATIESDPSFITFKENLLAEALENSKPGGKTIKQHYFETEISTTEEVNTTPLLEYLKVRRAEKARIREERREEKKRKELERKLKQKTKDKKEGDEEEPLKEIKVITSKDRRDIKERDNRNVKKKDEKEKVKETRGREYKSRGGKSYQEERLKLAERREELKKRELQNSSDKKQDSNEVNDATEANDSNKEHNKTVEEKSVKNEKKRYDNRKGGKYDDDWKDDAKKRSRNDKNNSKRDGRDKKDEYSRRSSDKKNNDSDHRRKAKTFKGSESSRSDKRKTSSAQDEPAKKQSSASHDKKKKEVDVPEKTTKSLDDLTLISALDGNKSESPTAGFNPNKIIKRSSSLENSRTSKTTVDSSLMSEVEKVVFKKKDRATKHSDNSSSLRSRKDTSNRKSYSEEKSLSSKNKERSQEKLEGSKEEQASKNLVQDSGCGGDNSTNKPKEPSRAERRIRNKDRPSIEIYRPGMGKFSKQRLEKEKALGSSTEVESPSHSPSPTPKSKLIS